MRKRLMPVLVIDHIEEKRSENYSQPFLLARAGCVSFAGWASK